VNILLKDVQSTFVVDKPESFLEWLKNAADPSLQLVNVQHVTDIIVTGFNEKIQLLEYVDEKAQWFEKGLFIVNSLASKDNTLFNSIALNVTLVFVQSIESSKDESIRKTYEPKFLSLLHSFTTSPDPYIRQTALSETVQVPSTQLSLLASDGKHNIFGHLFLVVQFNLTYLLFLLQN